MIRSDAAAPEKQQLTDEEGGDAIIHAPPLLSDAGTFSTLLGPKLQREAHGLVDDCWGVGPFVFLHVGVQAPIKVDATYDTESNEGA